MEAPVRFRESSTKVVGFWEQAVFQDDGLKVVGWAIDKADGLPPSVFLLLWENQVERLTPSVQRMDVASTLRLGVTACGFSATVPIRLPVDRDWPPPRIVALWPDGTTCTLAQLQPVAEGHLKSLAFSTFEQYARSFQNPAFRIRYPLIQAYGARRALALAEPGSIFWQSAAVVALYRCFQDGLFPADFGRALIETWREKRPEIEPDAKGEAMRWAISMDLACGYAHLAWREYDEARDFFEAIPAFADRINSWPQAVTNIGIGMFVAAWLEYRSGRTEEAIFALRDAGTLFQAGTAALSIWSWHHFEELKNALRILQQCFGFLKRLDGTKEEHIIPLTVRLSLRDISLVLDRLVDEGLEDGPFPGPNGTGQPIEPSPSDDSRSE